MCLFIVLVTWFDSTSGGYLFKNNLLQEKKKKLPYFSFKKEIENQIYRCSKDKFTLCSRACYLYSATRQANHMTVIALKQQ